MSAFDNGYCVNIDYFGYILMQRIAWIRAIKAKEKTKQKIRC